MATYTDTQKMKAVDLYVEVGTAEAARRTGVTTRTITTWAKSTGVTSAERAKKVEHTNEARDIANTERRLRIREKVLAKIEDMLDRMDEPLVD
ncbi:MAG: transposase, partial [Actinomycetota bacterium]|nr:transposase [Actinomycetota bacterium]